MPEVSQSITINAPVGRVFEVVTTPSNWTQYVTSLTEVSNLSADAPSKGSTFAWEYKMMGVKFRGKGTVTENQRDRKFGLVLEGRFPIMESYDFRELEDGKTELGVSINYEMPGEMLKIISSSSLIEKLNQLESKNVLEKIKTLCEGG